MSDPESGLIKGKEKLVSKGLIVIKLGGAEGIDSQAAIRDVADLHKLGQPFILVHGGSHEANVLSEKLGHSPVFITLSSGAITRYTNRETIEIFTMACGMVSKSIVGQLQRLGVNAVGLSGLDGRLLEGRRKEILKGTRVGGGKSMVFRDNFAGTVEKINTELLRLLLNNNYLPVISPLVLSEQQETINVDGDTIAALIAKALTAQKLIFLSNVPGLLRNPDDNESLVRAIPADELSNYMDLAKGRMRYKLQSAQTALAAGIEVVISDGRVPDPVSNALSGCGTVMRAK